MRKVIFGLVAASACSTCAAQDEPQDDDTNWDEDDVNKVAERPKDHLPRYKCEGPGWIEYERYYQNLRSQFYDGTLRGDELEDAKWEFSNLLRMRTNNVTDVLNCNVGVVAGYHLLSRIWLQEHDWRRAFRLAELALIFIFTLRNAVKVPRSDSLVWGTSAAEVIHEIKTLKAKVDRMEYTQRWQKMRPVAPDFRAPGMRIALVSICAYPDSFPIALTRVTPDNRNMYAQKHGYAAMTHREHPMPHGKVHIQHSKLYLISSYLRSGDYDWVGWLDCDSLIMTMNKTIDSIVYRYTQQVNETYADWSTKKLSGDWEDSFTPDPDLKIQITHRHDEIVAQAPQIGQVHGRIIDMGRKLTMYFDGGALDAMIIWDGPKVTLEWENGAEWIMVVPEDEYLPDCTNEQCDLELNDDVQLLITEEGWGMSSANWLIKATDWAINFLESAFMVAHEDIPLFGDQDAMILMLTNFRSLGSWETPAATGVETWDPVDPHALLIPQREINAYDALNAHFMQCDAWEPGDLLITFPSCKDPEGCNPFFETAYEYGKHSLKASDESFYRSGAWSSLRVFGPQQTVADIFNEQREEERAAKLYAEQVKRESARLERQTSILIEEEQRIHEEEARRSELTQEEIWELEELERQREEEEEQRREQEERERAQLALEAQAAARERDHAHWEEEKLQEVDQKLQETKAELEKIVISSDGGAEFGAMKKIKPSVQVETATAKPMGLDDIMAERQTKLKSLKPLEPLPEPKAPEELAEGVGEQESKGWYDTLVDFVAPVS